VDGDTIDVSIAGQNATVRYIGVDTPETVDPRQPVGCYGHEASAFNKMLVEGENVELEKDVSETDRFGRLLRYVFVDGQMVNEMLVRDGYAVVGTYPPDVKFQERFLMLQREAREAGRGLWAACNTPAAGSTPQYGNCSPAYPTVCIPPPPPDLDCADISFRRFTVLPPDPHRLDGNSDGVGCEAN
jgi:micrococcal nuclease